MRLAARLVASLAAALAVAPCLAWIDALHPLEQATGIRLLDIRVARAVLVARLALGLYDRRALLSLGHA
jgi:hypothetical protein